MIPADIDLGFILEEEGFDPRPHWPGGRSGVTIGPGIDLGHAEIEVVVNALTSIDLNPEQLADVVELHGLRRRGEDARGFLKAGDSLAKRINEIEFTREQVEAMLPVAAEPYWKAMAARFPGLLAHAGTPSGVKTAFLSLAYNRGPHNPDLEQLRKSLDTGNWPALGDLIEEMEEIPERRAREAELVRNRGHAEFLRYFRGYRWFQSSEIRRAAGHDVPSRPWKDAQRALLTLDAAREAAGVSIALHSVLQPGSRRAVLFWTREPATIAWHAGVHTGATYGTYGADRAMSFDESRNLWRLTA